MEDDKNMNEVKALRTQLETFNYIVNDSMTQVTQLKKDLTDQKTWTCEQIQFTSGHATNEPFRGTGTGPQLIMEYKIMSNLKQLTKKEEFRLWS